MQLVLALHTKTLPMAHPVDSNLTIFLYNNLIKKMHFIF